MFLCSLFLLVRSGFDSARKRWCNVFSCTDQSLETSTFLLKPDDRLFCFIHVLCCNSFFSPNFDFTAPF